MNCTYRSIWNDSTGTFVAVSENAKSAGKKTSSSSHAVNAGAGFALQALAISVALAFGGNAFAGPAGGVVAAGAANISTAAGNTTINQITQNAAINWQSFNIASGEAVQFVQPNSSSVTLNRVLGADPSSILGSMSANGKVFLVNPNGVLFGKGASVNVGGLVASTLNIADSDFMAGNYKFSGSSNGAVLNQGTINADGGYVALLGANVGNDGVIAAQLGTVALAAGNAITLDVAGDGLLNVSVNQGAVNALAQNGGLIQADGGQVLLTAQSASALLPSAVNNTGVIRAQTLVTGQDGSIMLMGDMQSGTVNVGGTLDASAPNGGNGGFIETSAAHVKVADDARLTTLASAGKTGTWLIDPQDFTIGTGGDILGTTLEGQLVTNSIVISTVTTGVNTPPTNYYGVTNGAGDINVNDSLSWTPSSGVPTTLTLNAAHDVNFNANITTVGGNLVANAGNDVNVKAGLSTGIRATFAAGDSGNITWSAVGDVIINSQVTATGSAAGLLDGNFTVCCGRDIKVNAATTTTDGDTILKAGRDIIVNAAMTTTGGNVILRAGGEPSAAVPGLIGGTVVFATATPYTVNGVPSAVTVDYTPTSYATPNNYLVNFTGDGTAQLQSHMLVFAQGNNKIYDGNNVATLSFRGDPTLGGNVTLVPGTGLFNNKDVGTAKPITYTGYSLGGTDAAKFALWGICTDAYGSGITNANITPRPVTVQADSATKVYGQTFTPLATAFTVPVPPLAGETITSVTETTSGTAATVPVASYPITPSNATGANFNPANYTITYLNGALVVTPAPLVLTANDAAKVYGTTFTPAGTAFTQVGLVNSDTVTNVVETSTGSVATAPVVGSPYPIVITPGSAIGSFTPTNYTITYVDGKLTVTPAALTVKANDASKVYGQAVNLPATAFTTTGLVNSDTVTSVTETSPGTVPTAPVAGSPYAITPSGATGTYVPSNYTVSYVNGALTVTPSPLTVTANDVTKNYGETPILSGFTTTPLVNGETVGSVTETSPGQPATAPAGTTYPITAGSATGGTFTPSNYTIGYVNGVLTVLPLAVVVPPVVPPVVVVPPSQFVPPVVVTPATPPQLFTLAPPPMPPVVVPPVLVVEQPPVIVAPETPPEIYVAPKRARKQERN